MTTRKNYVLNLLSCHIIRFYAHIGRFILDSYKYATICAKYSWSQDIHIRSVMRQRKLGKYRRVRSGRISSEAISENQSQWNLFPTNRVRSSD